MTGHKLWRRGGPTYFRAPYYFQSSLGGESYFIFIKLNEGEGYTLFLTILSGLVYLTLRTSFVLGGEGYKKSKIPKIEILPQVNYNFDRAWVNTIHTLPFFSKTAFL